MNSAIHKSTEESPIILWGVSASPYVRKVMVALAEKKLPYEQREIFPKNISQALGVELPEDFNRASPLGKIPAVQIGNYYVADSAVIAGYLDRKFPTLPKLYPADPDSYARTLWFEHYSDNELTAVAYKKIFVECVIKPKVLKIETNHELVNHAKNKELPNLLDYLNTEVTRFDWLSGIEFSMADIAISTQLLALTQAGIEIKGHWNNLSHYLDKVTSRPSFHNIISK